MAAQQSGHIQLHRGENTRIGPITIITLLTVVCMVVLAVLAVSTAQATTAISQRQATAAQRLYQNELAGQEFIAGVDDVLAGVRTSGGTAAAGARAVDAALDDLCAAARQAADNQVECTANVSGTTVSAAFTCQDARLLNVAVTIQDDASYRIDEWKISAAPQEAQPGGQLWTGD